MINYSKLERGKVNNYHLGFTNKLLQEDFFEQVQKEIINFCNSVFASNSLESWNKVRHADETIGKRKHFVFGGGYEGDTIEKFNKLIKENNLLYFSNLLEALHTKNFTDYIFKNLNLKLSYKPFRLVSKDFKQGLFGLKEQPVFMNFKLSCYPPESGIAFHRDNQRKLVGMLLFFGFSDNENREIGGTQFATDEMAPKNWSKNQINHSFHDHTNLHIIHDHKPLPNSFAAFNINDHSWHRIDPYQSNEDIFRINLQINFMRVNKRTFPLKLFEKILSLIKKS